MIDTEFTTRLAHIYMVAILCYSLFCTSMRWWDSHRTGLRPRRECVGWTFHYAVVCKTCKLALKKSACLTIGKTRDYVDRVFSYELFQNQRQNNWYPGSGSCFLCRKWRLANQGTYQIETNWKACHRACPSSVSNWGFSSDSRKYCESIGTAPLSSPLWLFCRLDTMRRTMWCKHASQLECKVRRWVKLHREHAEKLLNVLSTELHHLIYNVSPIRPTLSSFYKDDHLGGPSSKLHWQCLLQTPQKSIVSVKSDIYAPFPYGIIELFYVLCISSTHYCFVAFVVKLRSCWHKNGSDEQHLLQNELIQLDDLCIRDNLSKRADIGIIHAHATWPRSMLSYS